MKEAQTNSVRNLEYLYSAVVGLGLALAVYNFIDINRTPVPIRVELLPFFIVFLVTLFPFYHGALRHLDVTYIEHGGKQVASGGLMADFSMLFVESCLLLALAVLITNPRIFAWCLLILIAFDTIWGLIVHFAFSPEEKPKAELRWAYINLTTSFLLIILLVTIDAVSQQIRELLFWIILLGLALGRTIVDYALCWEFYYPSVYSSNS